MSFHEKVWPRTLIIKMVDHPYGTQIDPIQVAQIWGGREDDVWVGTFADRDEAETFILASNHFGHEVIGIKIHGATGKQDRAVPTEANDGSGGSGGEACESGSERGPRPDSIVS